VLRRQPSKNCHQRQVETCFCLKWSGVARGENTPDFDGCVVGEINLDLILHGLPKELIVNFWRAASLLPWAVHRLPAMSASMLPSTKLLLPSIPVER